MQGKASCLNDRGQDITMDIQLNVKIASVTKTLATDTKIKLTKITILYFLLSMYVPCYEIFLYVL